ncbi:MAG: hypothetical protein MZV64_69740 [Ignavibacteriales bacterium]|nr:hypothetical protein [Ignavibacteriales bacterium]
MEAKQLEIKIDYLKENIKKLELEEDEKANAINELTVKLKKEEEVLDKTDLNSANLKFLNRKSFKT